ncbi:S-layer homology domain-containing protein [Lyngbya confervoides]|uniref:S-layer homology domain-containing protein n=1 Tax=Lyngbya confervoides BDU141951 TaxID=1574623 RepID=A0ABD4T6N6_9CYAN|nr:S-layer homology domain-containing protein [Lyngbya confervoides]MCM1984135.1 S-layer homology domain-containing protein [Lyngbya confervoides BDU141951]
MTCNLVTRYSHQGPATITWVSALSILSFAITDPAVAQGKFTDVGDRYWARPFIESLAQENIIKGFPDGTFKPDQPVTRAQFAAIIKQAFSIQPIRPSRPFKDVASSYWATPAIDYAYTTGFLSGYTSGDFSPEQNIPKVQALVSLASGLKLTPRGSVEQTLTGYADASQIPNYARPGVAAATQQRIPVNYPNLGFLNPNQQASRADIAAYIYQALVSQGRLTPIASTQPAAQYIVQSSANSTHSAQVTLPSGTALPVKVPDAQESANLFLAVGETLETSLEVAADILDANGQRVIPQGSLIQGRFQPLRVGNTAATQFIASQIRLGNQTYSLNATSTAVAPQSQSAVTSQDLQGSISTLSASTLLQTLLSGRLDTGSLISRVIRSGANLSQGSSGASTASDQVVLVNLRALDLRLNAPFSVTSSQLPTSPSHSAAYEVRSGTQLALTSRTANTRYVSLPNETLPLTLKTAETLYDSQNRVLIPQGSEVRGSLIPARVNGQAGAIFEATQMTVGGKTYPVSGFTPGIMPRSTQTLTLADFQGNVVTSPDAGILLQSLRQNPNAGSASSIIFFDPDQIQLEFDRPVLLTP